MKICTIATRGAESTRVRDRPVGEIFENLLPWGSSGSYYFLNKHLKHEYRGIPGEGVERVAPPQSSEILFSLVGNF